MKPQFIIIGGPNGAGKSTFSHMHVPLTTPIFNGDKVFEQLQLQYPTIESERLVGGVTVALEKARDKALAERTDFVFESNFSNNMALELTHLFKDAGFETTMLYFGLPNVTVSTNRVVSRIELGGHDVPNDQIDFNFKDGIKRLKANFDLFDHLKFIDTSIAMTAPIIAFLNKPQLKFQILNENIEWFNRYFKKDMERHFLETKENQERGTSKGLRR